MKSPTVNDADYGASLNRGGHQAAWLFVILAVIVVVGLEPFRSRDSSSLGQIVSGEGSLSRQLIYLAITVALLAVFVKARGFGGFRQIPFVLGLTLAWCIMSAVWSIAPEATIRRAGLTALIVLCIFMTIALLGSDRTLTLLRAVLAGVLVVNLASLALVPQAVHQANGYDASAVVGSWRGMHFHKNLAGSISAMSALLFLHYAIDNKRPSDFLLFIGAVIFTIGAQSKAAIVLLVFAACALIVYRTLNKTRYGRRILTTSVVALTGLSLMLAAAFHQEFLAILTDPSTLTGRGAIWQLVLVYARDHTLLGAGFGAFWQSESSPIRSLTAVRWLLVTAQTHNGYLEMLVSTGVIGLGLALVAAVVVPMAKLLSRSTRHGSLLFAWLLFGAVLNLTETSLFDTDSEEWVIYAVAIMLVYSPQMPPTRAS